MTWEVDKVLHFNFQTDFVKDGLAHFGFHDSSGRLYALSHQGHFLGLVGDDGGLEWTLAPSQVFKDTPNIAAELRYPIYIDTLPEGSLVVSNFGDSRLFRVDPVAFKASLFADGSILGIRHAGNCIVDNEGFVWVNDVDGCRIWRFDSGGHPVLTLGNGEPGFQSGDVSFEDAQFNWIYDIRKGPDGNLYVLDSKNFAVRMVDLMADRVRTIAGSGKPGYGGDGGDPLLATFGSDPSAQFDGPISMSLDESGNIFVGDRFNHVVRMIDMKSRKVSTIAGDCTYSDESPNDPREQNPLALRLPKISSMDYHGGRLFVPTDLTNDSGDLVVLHSS